ncbi:hypothetical protein GCM10028801_38070 [Nocardioides maradonensis]
MPVQIDQVEVISAPATEPATPTSAPGAPAPAADVTEQMRAWARAAACRSDRLRAD